MTTRLATRAVQLLVALVLACAGVLAVQPSADAATAVKFCFRYQASGMHSGEAYASKPVYLKNAATRATIKSGRTNSAGCATFTRVPSTLTVYVRAYYVLGDANIGMAFYEGTSPYLAGPGTGTVAVGTGVVGLTCTDGYYASCAGQF